ncbi:hypothetical protein BRADI_3g20615v3 [Brachypodium distachyon]|uniref:Uncharacterized protein n=1 Tax=Brachypodium distachyon TaxID=15368 RepID=A0A0Q3FCW3_BRADI|nr:hypothetical protein BRADI_3g20615v3 [Brachypodium distachyon]
MLRRRGAWKRTTLRNAQDFRVRRAPRGKSEAPPAWASIGLVVLLAQMNWRGIRGELACTCEGKRKSGERGRESASPEENRQERGNRWRERWLSRRFKLQKDDLIYVT